jgi:hypothetical protein
MTKIELEMVDENKESFFSKSGDKILREKFIDQFFEKDNARDFCKNYRLEDAIKEKTFNLKYNSDKYIHVFRKDRDYTDIFSKSRETRIKNQSNIILIIHGEPHSGKSEVGQSISFDIKLDFKKYVKIDSKIYIGFSTVEFNTILRDIEIGDVLIRDESPKASGSGSRTIKNNLNNIIEMVRANQNCFIFISPKRVESNVVTYYLEMAGKKSIYDCPECGEKYVNKDRSALTCDKCKAKLELNYKESSCRCILYDPSYMDGKIPIGRIFIYLHEEHEFRKEYEKKKKYNIKGTLKQGGMVSAELDRKRYRNDLLELIEQCKRTKARTLTTIRSQIQIYNQRFDPIEEIEKMIKGDTNYVNTLITSAFLYITGKSKLKELLPEIESDKKTEKRVTELLSTEPLEMYKKYKFEYTEEQIFEDAKDRWRWKNPDRDYDIYKRRTGVRPEKIEMLTEEYKIAPGTVNYGVFTTEKHFAKSKGILFEEGYEKYLKNMGYYEPKDVNRIGEKGKPDILAVLPDLDEVHVFSLKVRNFRTDRRTFTHKDMGPEIETALKQNKKHKKTILYLVVYDLSADEILIKSVDYKSNDSVSF